MNKTRFAPAIVFAFLVSACSGAMTPAPQNAAGAVTALNDRPACAGSRIGQAQCDALIAPPGINGWTAADLESAYNLPSSKDGTGNVVAIVDAYDNPNVASDLAKYRSTMGLPAATFYKYNQEGQQSNYPQGSTGWGVEIDLDTQMASAGCPNCTIYLIEANSNAWSDIEAAETEAVKLGATLVSNSFDGSGADKKYFDTKGVEYVASAGDSGYGVLDPAAFASVVAVGGTVLTQSTSCGPRGWCEMPWSSSGGGCVSGKRPPWQHDASCKGRLANDVSAVAVGLAEYDTYGESGWISVDGTSISCPFVAAIFGLAGNSTRQDGGRTFWLPDHHKYLYQITKPRYSEQGGWGTPDGIGAF